MIGFRPDDGTRPRALGPHEYRTIRRARFFQLAIDSDDWTLVWLLGFFLTGCLFGVMVCR